MNGSKPPLDPSCANCLVLGVDLADDPIVALFKPGKRLHNRRAKSCECEHTKALSAWSSTPAKSGT